MALRNLATYQVSGNCYKKVEFGGATPLGRFLEEFTFNVTARNFDEAIEKVQRYFAASPSESLGEIIGINKLPYGTIVFLNEPGDVNICQ